MTELGCASILSLVARVDEDCLKKINDQLVISEEYTGYESYDNKLYIGVLKDSLAIFATIGNCDGVSLRDIDAAANNIFLEWGRHTLYTITNVEECLAPLTKISDGVYKTDRLIDEDEEVETWHYLYLNNDAVLDLWFISEPENDVYIRVIKHNCTLGVFNWMRQFLTDDEASLLRGYKF